MGAAQRLFMPPFRPPNAVRRAAAIGDTSNPREDPKVKGFLEMGNENLEYFRPIPVPGISDWLANHPERGQTFDEWFKLLGKNDVLHGERRVIYVLPILKNNPNREENPSQFLELLKTYAKAFFVGMDVMMLPSVSSGELGCKTRLHEVIQGVKREQMLAPDILKYIQRDMPYDAYCVIGVTMVDLYPDEKWNFVFGQASLVRRCGIFSFARYHPNFLDTKDVNDTMESILELSPDDLRLGLRRSFEILTHEVSHMFGIQHCIYFACLMNGSNHQKESDSRPIFLCPVCLRKLQHAIGFDTVKRYEGMLEVFLSIDKQFPLPEEEKEEAEPNKQEETAPTRVEGEKSISTKEGEADKGEECTTKAEESKLEEDPAMKEEASSPEQEGASTVTKDVDKITECILWLTKVKEYFSSI